jgi:hypothetical protein
MEHEVNAMRALLWMMILVAPALAACNYTDGECYARGQGSGNVGGGSVILPGGAGGFGDAPPKTLQDCNAPATPSPSDMGSSTSSAGNSGGQEALLQQELDDDQGAGGLTCTSPENCVEKCVAESKYCFAAHAVHPYKPEQIGDLFQCIDTFPKAKYGGSYTCLYRFPSGDACIFAYGSKLGPITFPAPPPLCVYKGK